MSDFPTSLDSFVDEEDGVSYPVASDMNGVYDALEKIEAKVGVDSSSVASSIDFKLANTTSGHDHDGSDSKKVTATNLNPSGLTASQLLRVNSGGTAVESAGYTIATLMSALWPVGSIYMNVTGTNPGTELGFGTWSQIAEGQMLIGQKDSDADFDTAEETGGAKTATLTTTELPAHTHTGAAHTHTGPSHTHTGTTGNQSANHNHTYQYNNTATGGYGLEQVSGYVNRVQIDQPTGSTGNNSTSHNHSFTTGAGGTGNTGSGGDSATSSTGSGTAFSIVNPYFVAYIFKRTA